MAGRGEVARRVPVGPRQIDGAARCSQPDGEIMPASYRVTEADRVPPHDVAKVPHATHLNQDNPLWSTSKRESSLKHDIGTRLCRDQGS